MQSRNQQDSRGGPRVDSESEPEVVLRGQEVTALRRVRRPRRAYLTIVTDPASTGRCR